MGVYRTGTESKDWIRSTHQPLIDKLANAREELNQVLRGGVPGTNKQAVAERDDAEQRMGRGCRDRLEQDGDDRGDAVRPQKLLVFDAGGATHIQALKDHRHGRLFAGGGVRVLVVVASPASRHGGTKQVATHVVAGDGGAGLLAEVCGDGGVGAADSGLLEVVAGGCLLDALLGSRRAERHGEIEVGDNGRLAVVFAHLFSWLG